MVCLRSVVDNLRMEICPVSHFNRAIFCRYNRVAGILCHNVRRGILGNGSEGA